MTLRNQNPNLYASDFEVYPYRYVGINDFV